MAVERAPRIKVLDRPAEQTRECHAFAEQQRPTPRFQLANRAAREAESLRDIGLSQPGSLSQIDQPSGDL